MKSRVVVSMLLVSISLACGSGKRDHEKEAADPNRSLFEAFAEKIRPSTLPLDLSRAPSDEELMAAGQFGGLLHPVGTDLRPDALGKEGQTARAEEMNRTFGKAIQTWNDHYYKDAAALFQKHVQAYPDSPWSAEAILHMGCEAKFNGRYEEAAKHFQTLLDRYQGKPGFGESMIYHKALGRMAVLSFYRGDLPKARELFSQIKETSPSWRQRTYAASFLTELARRESAPTASANCGGEALAHAFLGLQDPAHAAQALRRLPSASAGHSLAELSVIAQELGYLSEGVRLRPADLSTIAYPFVLRLKTDDRDPRGHYWVAEGFSNKRVALYDPQARRRFFHTPDELFSFWDGSALMVGFADGVSRLIPLSGSQMDELRGGCCGIQRPEGELGDPGENAGRNLAGDGAGPCGSPTWSVNMVNMNIYVKDVPLWYSPAFGPAMNLMLSYNSQAALAEYEPFGNKWTASYASYLVEDPGKTVTVFMPDGRRDVYTPQADGSFSPPRRVYNQLVRLSAFSFELKTVDGTTFRYQRPEGTGMMQVVLTAITDPLGHKLSMQYDASGKLSAIVDALGQKTMLEYKNGLVTKVVDPFGRSALFEYDEKRNLTQITDMGGYATKLSYDADRYIQAMDKGGAKTTFGIEPADGIPNNKNPYPAAGKPMWEDYRITVTDASGACQEYHYDGDKSRSWYVAPNQCKPYQNGVGVPKTIYGLSGEWVSDIQSPSGETVYLSYDSASGALSSLSFLKPSGSSLVYRLTHNSKGQLTSVQEPDGQVSRYTYDSTGVLLTEVVTAMGTAKMEYDTAGQITKLTKNQKVTTTFSYNDKGQLERVVSPLEGATEIEYGADLFPRKLRQNGAVTSQMTYDTLGRLESLSNEFGHTLRYGYDNLNQLTKIERADGYTVRYQYAGRCPRTLEKVEDSTGRMQLYGHDLLNRLIRVVTPDKTELGYGYDPSGNLTELRDAQHKLTRFAYDADNRLVQRILPDGSSYRIEYYGSQISKKVDPRGITASYTYDTNLRLTDITYSDSTPAVHYEYEAAGRVKSIRDATGTRTLTYQSGDSIKTITGPGEKDGIEYLYDDLERVAGVVPKVGQAITYKYDPSNRLEEILAGGKKYRYQYHGQSSLVERLTHPNGVKVDYDYFPDGKLRSIASSDSTDKLLLKHALEYNLLGKVIKEKISEFPGLPDFSASTKTGTFNAANQLTTEKTATADGNKEQANQYDKNGNMTQGYTPEGAPFQATYDAESRLTTIQFEDKNKVAHKRRYTYSDDHLLARIEVFQNGKLVKDTQIQRDGFLPLQDRNAVGGSVDEYVWGNDLVGGIGGLLSMRRAGNDYQYLYDGRGNVAGIADENASVIARYAYSSYGALLKQIGAIDQSFGHSTKRMDPQVGLAYFGYRFYLQNHGRWLTMDPIGEMGGINLYEFTAGDPVNYVDPEGNTIVPLAGVGFVIGSGASAIAYFRYYRAGRISGWQYFKAIALGGALGASAAVMPGYVMGATGSALGSAINNMYSQVLLLDCGSKPNGWQVARAAFWGGITGILGALSTRLGERIDAAFMYHPRNLLSRGNAHIILRPRPLPSMAKPGCRDPRCLIIASQADRTGSALDGSTSQGATHLLRS